MIALIPARAGSKRVKGKNIRELCDHPLIAYTIQSALDSCIFKDVYVSSDSSEILEISEYYGAKPIKRPKKYAKDTSPDADFIKHANMLLENTKDYAILRPTSPLRTHKTIRKAFKDWDMVSLMKSVTKSKENPLKMWEIKGDYMLPVIDHKSHLLQTNTLKQYYVQTGSLEFRYRDEALSYQPFLISRIEGFDINTEGGWSVISRLINDGIAKLPKIGVEPWKNRSR